MSTVIPLRKPVKDGGVSISSLTMREPTVQDNLNADQMQGTPAMNEVNLFMLLCEVGPGTIEQLTMRDYKKLQKAYLDFLKDEDEEADKAKPGTKS